VTKRLFPIVRQPEDKRDHPLCLAPAKPIPASIPPDFTIPIFDQGSTNTCALNAGASALWVGKGKTGPVWSRAFLVWAVGIIERDHPEEDGVKTIRNVCKALLHSGDCTEPAYPFTDADMHGTPPPVLVNAAKANIIKCYEACVGLVAIKQAIAAGRPVLAGIDCFAGIQSAKTAKTGIVPLPRKGEQSQGGHGILLLGYDAKRIWFVNSWSASWGSKGWGILSNAYCQQYLFDAWSIIV